METAINYKEDFTLSQYWEMAYRANTGTSFSPDKRANDTIKSHSEELDSDLAGMAETERLQYKANYIKYFTAWLSSKGNCVSTMITGGSNFNVRRAEKANQSERNRVNDFINWREAAMRAIAKRKEDSKPQAQKDSELFERWKKGFDSSAETIAGLDNGTVRGYSRALFVSNIVGKINTIAKTGNVELLTACLNYIKSTNQFPFLKKPIISDKNSIWKLLESAEATREAQFDRANKPNREWQTERCVVRFNYELDRLQLVFDGRPDYSTIQQLKKAAFKWSPTNTAWQRQLTNNAIHGAISVIGEFRTVAA